MSTKRKYCSSYFSLIASILILIVSILIIYLHNLISPSLEYPVKNLKDEVVVITGGCSGVGLETTKMLFLLNATIIIGCRNLTIGNFICNYLNNKNKNSGICYSFELDLASFKSTREFASNIGFLVGKMPNILINNAAIRDNHLTTTEDGIESQYQINHLSHFLLTHLLLPYMLRSSKQIRIVHVSSSAHMFGTIDKEAYCKNCKNIDSELFNTKQYTSLEGVYGDTKLMQILFSNELQRRFDSSVNKKKDLKSKAISVAVHPGFVSSNIGFNDTRLLQYLVLLTRPLLARTSQQGAISVVFACINSGLTGGEYIENSQVSSASHKAGNISDAFWLWLTSSAITNITTIDD